MKTHKMRRAVLGATVTIGLLAAATPALAAQYNDISGNVYQGGAYFVSNNDRNVNTRGGVTARQYTTNLPYSGLKMYLQTASGGNQLTGVQSWTSNNVGKDLGRLSDGVRFNTVTAQNSRGGSDNYWEGKFYY